MICPKCQQETIVLDSRNGGSYRRRKCGTCNYRFSTVEIYGELVDARAELEQIAMRAGALKSWIEKFLANDSRSTPDG